MFKKSEVIQVNSESGKVAIKRLRQQAFITLLMLLVSLTLLIIASAAWFANNKNVNSGGSEVSVEASPNLIIATSPAILTAKHSNLDEMFSVVFSQPVIRLRPATHNDNSPTGLVYNSNPQEVSFSTGKGKNEDSILAFENVPKYIEDSNEARYYYDYTVYIASAGKELKVDSLVAKLSYQDFPQKDVEDHIHATSVDFYLNGVYKATDNLKNKNYAATASLIEPVVIVHDNSGIRIPYNNALLADKYWTITMRFYFDGALEKSEGQTYVYSDNLTPVDLNLKVDFVAVEL